MIDSSSKIKSAMTFEDENLDEIIHTKREWRIARCRDCKTEFVFAVRFWHNGTPMSENPPLWCRPCAHLRDAAKAERIAAKHRKAAREAVGPRDRFVRKIKSKQ